MICKLRAVLPILTLIALLGVAIGYLSSNVAQHLKPPNPASNLLSGPARAIDGNTLVIKGQVVKLYGIDAPEYDQSCVNADGQNWPCGRAAEQSLNELVATGHVACREQGQPSARGVEAVCEAQGRNLNERMLARGLAWANPEQAAPYADVEQFARAHARGVFQAENTSPWEYRLRRDAERRVDLTRSK